MQATRRLRALLAEIPNRLDAIPAEQAARKPAPGKWSPKEELGHLIDSASNNHQRVVRAQLDENPSLPGYDGDRWVALHRYQGRDWQELIDIWQLLNVQLLAAAEAIPESGWSRTCSIAQGAPVTLDFLLNDYLDHMSHHLRHIGIPAEGLNASASTG